MIRIKLAAMLLVTLLSACSSEISREDKPQVILEGDALYYQAVEYSEEGNLIEADKYFQYAFDTYSSVDYLPGKIYSLLGLAGTSNSLKNYSDSENYLRHCNILFASQSEFFPFYNLTKAEIYFENHEFQKLNEFIIGLNNLGSDEIRMQLLCYKVLALLELNESYVNEKNDLISHYNLFKVNADETHIQGTELHGFLVYTFAEILLRESNYPEALKCFEESLNIYKKLNKSLSIGNSLYKISQIHLLIKNYSIAYEFALRAQSLFTSINNEAGMKKLAGLINMISSSIPE
ncbi:MAG: tetratricopeptide repeat protein [Bacteroidetes bacterium]|nr:tetratricopeptide repeat protein [Bacteroidota bacterium]